jgi:GNAT superfamily N-acetyltransferase
MIRPVETEADRASLRLLLESFHEWMVANAGEVYDPEAELAEDLRSLSEGTESWAWVARHDGEPAGCVLLYGQTDDLAEFRRLWVTPAHRGEGIGRALVDRVVTAARDRGSGTLGLTTPPWSEAAHELHESMGFERTPPYPETRLDGTHHEEALFMQRDLDSAGRDG